MSYAMNQEVAIKVALSKGQTSLYSGIAMHALPCTVRTAYSANLCVMTVGIFSRKMALIY